MPGLARRISAHRPAWTFQQLRSLYSHRRFNVQPARQMAKGDVGIVLAPRYRVAELSARFTCLAAGSQWLHASGPRLSRSRHQQEGRHRTGLPAARCQLPVVRLRSLPAQPPIRQRRGGRQAPASAMAVHRRRGNALHRRNRNLAVGQQRSGLRPGRGHGLLRRHAHPGDPGRGIDPSRISAGIENPGHQCRRSHAFTVRERTSARPERDRLQFALHEGQAHHFWLSWISVAGASADLPSNEPEPARSRLQRRRHHHDAIRHACAEQTGPIPSGGRRDRPAAAAGHERRLREADRPGQAHRAQILHRPPRPGPAQIRNWKWGATNRAGAT